MIYSVMVLSSQEPLVGENVALGTVEHLQVKATIFDLLPARGSLILQPRICNVFRGNREERVLIACVSD